MAQMLAIEGGLLPDDRDTSVDIKFLEVPTLLNPAPPLNAEVADRGAKPWSPNLISGESTHR